MKKRNSYFLLVAALVATSIFSLQSCDEKEEGGSVEPSNKPKKITMLSNPTMENVLIPTSLLSASSTGLIEVEEILVVEDTINKGNTVNFIAKYTIDTVNHQLGYFQINEEFQNWLTNNYGYDMDKVLEESQSFIYASLKERPLLIPSVGDNQAPINAKPKLCSESGWLRKLFIGCIKKSPDTVIPGGSTIPGSCTRYWYLFGVQIAYQSTDCPTTQTN